MIKVLKTAVLILFLIVSLVLIGGGYLAYKAYKTGEIGSVLKNVANTALDLNSKLSPIQQKYFDSGDYESLARDLEQNVTQEQVDCAIQVLGKERANELFQTKDPTPQEVLKLSKCL